MILTEELFELGKSSNNGYNKEQLRCLGITTLYKGWARSIIGVDFPDNRIKEFLELKDVHFKGRLKSGSDIKRSIAVKMGIITFSPVFEKLSYKEQYTHRNWQKMRLFVFERDKFMCVNCKSTTTTLHAHHLKYGSGFVWEVPHWYIVTLCEKCHSEEHGRDLTIKK